jgi:hypothetical protein
MKWFRGALFASALTGAAVIGSSAFADVYLISHSDTITSNWESLNVTGVDANAPAVGILFTIAGDSPTGVHGSNLLVLCDDLFHTVSVPVSYGVGHELEFDSAKLSGNFYYTSGGPQMFDLKQASLLGQLVTQAQHIYTGGAPPSDVSGLGLTTDQQIAAIQGAIWGIEYNTPVVSNGNANLTTAIGDYESEFTNFTANGVGLYSTNGTQNQLLPGVPEPASWLTMLLGVSAVGAVLRRRRALAAVAA